MSRIRTQMQHQQLGVRRLDVGQSFERVAAAELPSLLRFATALCGDPEQGRDIVQEVLARAFTRWDRIGTADRPAAYLMRMVTNEFLSWRRLWSTRFVLTIDDDALDQAAGAAPDHGEGIAERDDLERRIARLPRRQQVALVLRYYQGLEYAEVAAILGCAEGTARSACSRGLAALRLDDEQSQALARSESQ